MVITCPNHKGVESLFLHETDILCNSKHLIDEWSLAHFMSGFYLKSKFKNINFKMMLFIGILWELFEKTPLSVKLFDFLGPIAGVEDDASYTGDSLINSISDVVFYVFGWKLACKYDNINDIKSQKISRIVILLTYAWCSSVSYLKVKSLYKKI